jgi:hypothetical protein
MTDYKCGCGRDAVCEVDDWPANPYPCPDCLRRWRKLKVEQVVLDLPVVPPDEDSK